MVEIPNDNYIINLGDLIDDGTVEWGDDTYSHNTSTHKYSTSGIYTIKGKIYPNVLGLEPNPSFAQTILNVNKLPSIADNFENMFANCSILRIVNLENTNTSNIKNTNSMFKNCTSIITPPNFDFDSIIQANEMFKGCSNIINLTFKNLSNKDLVCNGIVEGCSRLATLGFTGRTHRDNAKKVIDILNSFILESKTDKLISSKEVDKINNYQDIQDEEILTNLMASADIFEMLINLIGMPLNDASKNKMVGSIVDVYVSLIVKGKKAIDDVPAVIRPQVEDMLKELI